MKISVKTAAASMAILWLAGCNTSIKEEKPEAKNESQQEQETEPEEDKNKCG